MFKVGNKLIALELVKFSESINGRVSSLKNTKYTEKLYSNMLKSMKDSEADKIFCMRCYNKNMSYLITSYTK